MKEAREPSWAHSASRRSQTEGLGCRATPDGQEEEFWVLRAPVEVTAVRCGGHGMTGLNSLSMKRMGRAA